MASKGTEVIYITGNHDELLRRFSDTKMGNFSIVDKLILDLNGQKAWFFQGDVFDLSIQNAKWLARLGGYGYDSLILMNRCVNWCLDKMGKEKYSLSSKIKQSVKSAVKYIQNFEETAASLAIENGYDYVVCGHIHQTKKEIIDTPKGRTTYLNSGDWVESLTALEFHFNRWKVYHYQKDKLVPFFSSEQEVDIDIIPLFPDYLKKGFL